jgi:hypothetical protein
MSFGELRVTDLATLATLRSLDDPRHTERPPGFDWRSADAQFRVMAAALAHALGVAGLEIEGVESIQDASFHGQVVLPPSAVSPGESGPAILCTSNFGRLAAVRPEAAVEPSALEHIRSTLAAHGYVYVPAELQDAPYEGAAEVDAIEPTWWSRYFEYQ